MGFLARMGGLVGAALLGFEAVGCGQVVGTNGGEGAGDFAGAPPVAPPDHALPAATDRFAFAKSGNRLQALGYVSEGVAQFRTLHDSLLDFDCEFVSGSDGNDSHCAPKRSGTLIFLDENCSEPATWILDVNMRVGEWLSIGPTSYDPPLPHRAAFELGEEVYPESITGTPPRVYSWQGTSCALAYAPAKGIPAVNRLIAHADHELVAAKSVSLDAGGGLRLTRLIGEDGSERTLAVTTAAGELCTIQPDGACMPQARDEAGPFPATQRIRQGSGAAHVDLFSSSPGTGQVGVPVAHFPEALDFLDQWGNPCQVVPAVDGTLRCATLEPRAYQSGGWADDTCTQRLYYGQPSGVDPSPLHAALYTDEGALVATSSVKPYDGPVYGFDNGNSCAPTMAAYDLLELDQRVDVSSLPEVFETTL